MNSKEPAWVKSVPLGLSAELKKDQRIDQLQCENKALKLEFAELKASVGSWNEQKEIFNRINKELPDGWTISWDMAPNNWGISLTDPESNDIEFSSDSAESDAQVILCALEHAKKISEDK